MRIWAVILCAVVASSCKASWALWTDKLMADIRSVHVVPTVQLLKDVPVQPGELYETYDLGANVTYKMRIRSPSHEWWNSRLWSRNLTSVVAKGNRHRGQALIGMLMADSRHSLWDNSDERHLLFRNKQGRREGMYLLPAAINFIYAMRQGYDFIHFKVPAEKMHRHSAWLKLVALRAMLPKYEYILYLDSDTFLRPPCMPGLAEMLISDGRLDNKAEDKLIAVTREDPRFPDIANTGVIMLRNASKSMEMLEDWWLAVIRNPQWNILLKAWSFEQGAFTHVVYPQYVKHVSLLELSQYNSPEGRHIRHIWSLLKNDEREEIFLGAAADFMRGAEGREQGDAALAAEHLTRGVQQALRAKAALQQAVLRTTN